MNINPIAWPDGGHSGSHRYDVARDVVTGNQREFRLVSMPGVLADPDVETVHCHRADSDQHFPGGRRWVLMRDEPKDLGAAML
jgi:hypothetical protein